MNAILDEQDLDLAEQLANASQPLTLTEKADLAEYVLKLIAEVRAVRAALSSKAP